MRTAHAQPEPAPLRTSTRSCATYYIARAWQVATSNVFYILDRGRKHMQRMQKNSHQALT